MYTEERTAVFIMAICMCLDDLETFEDMKSKRKGQINMKSLSPLVKRDLPVGRSVS